jgi:hypothetical protein
LLNKTDTQTEASTTAGTAATVGMDVQTEPLQTISSSSSSNSTRNYPLTDSSPGSYFLKLFAGSCPSAQSTSTAADVTDVLQSRDTVASAVRDDAREQCNPDDIGSCNCTAAKGGPLDSSFQPARVGDNEQRPGDALPDALLPLDSTSGEEMVVVEPFDSWLKKTMIEAEQTGTGVAAEATGKAVLTSSRSNSKRATGGGDQLMPADAQNHRDHNRMLQQLLDDVEQLEEQQRLHHRSTAGLAVGSNA